MQYKTTNKLFRGIYQYKVVLVVAGASWFRSGDMASVLETLKQVSINPNVPRISLYPRNKITQEDLDYAFKLQACLKKISDFEVRVESPWVSVYTNDKSAVDALTNLDPDKVKYVSAPPVNSGLVPDTVIMPKMDFDYRITLGKTIQKHDAFIQWAESNSKVKLTKSCIRELTRDRSWGGSHFYLTGDKNLLLAKMHLGGSINKVERIIKA